MNTINEWQRLAWALGAHDIATDIPAEPGSDEDDDEQADFRAWAERVHGAEARKLIVAFDAFTAIRVAAAPVVTGRAEQGSRA